MTLIPSDISLELTSINSTKADLKASIEAQGVTISDSAPFSSYAVAVSSIGTGPAMAVGIPILKDTAFSTVPEGYVGQGHYIFKNSGDSAVVGYSYNGTLTGSTVSFDEYTGILEGFGANSYLEVDEAFDISTANSWEVNVELTTGSNVSSSQYIIGLGRATSQGNSCGTMLMIDGGKIMFITPYASSGAAIEIGASIEANTTYAVKGCFTGTEYQLWFNDTKVASQESSNKGLYNSSYNDKFLIGQYRDIAVATAYYFQGQNINLVNCSVKIDGTNIWNGVTEIKDLATYTYPAFVDAMVGYFQDESNVETILYLDKNVIQVGGTMSSDYVYQAASSCYLEFPSSIPFSTADSWELRLKYTYNNLNASQFLLRNDDSGPSLEFYLYNENLGLAISPDHSTFPIDVTNLLAMTVGQVYYIKLGFTGTAYYVRYNTTGWNDSFTEIFSQASTDKVYETSGYSVLMGSKQYNWQYNTGYLDLKESSMTINGSTWWEGTINMTTVQNANGLTMFDMSHKSEVDDIYKKNGAVDSWGIDVTNERVFTPRKNMSLNLYYLPSESYRIDL